MLREVVPGALLVIFLICTTSFAVALTLGGGPRATTLEVAVYQALRFDFDLGRAVTLALVQLLLCGGIVAGDGVRGSWQIRRGASRRDAGRGNQPFRRGTVADPGGHLSPYFRSWPQSWPSGSSPRRS